MALAAIESLPVYSRDTPLLIFGAMLMKARLRLGHAGRKRGK
jgi:hypothetical protein